MNLPVNISVVQAAQDASKIQGTREIYRMLKPQLVGLGITFATAAASYFIVPDAAVKTKQEIDEGTELSKPELMLRKVAVMMIVNSVKDTMVNALNIASLLRAPGVESKVRASAALLSATPSLYTAFKILKRKLEGQEPSLNVRELLSPTEMKYMGAAAVAGKVLNGSTDSFILAEKLDKAGKLPF